MSESDPRQQAFRQKLARAQKKLKLVEQRMQRPDMSQFPEVQSKLAQQREDLRTIIETLEEEMKH